MDDRGCDLQGCKHVARRDAVDADAGPGPLNAERGAQVADGGLGGVVGAVVIAVVSFIPCVMDDVWSSRLGRGV
jgi:hypothetical protein